ncbi:DHHA1 domain-containing protein [Mechercharimyces sp. CAU 1602]|uniref:DHH family phosphoesterase n=1 Tax=Mechercharimyces sp. CAU 1602 TaxID=2973933 RepID=UPI0021627840|nr:DHHA1 domain-containing protein [Mechercharimyces sp. CAU 1602]MCS1350358.1 DHHA1 domain-containing protein [Mechercharimyces sp. CAU 1602]
MSKKVKLFTHTDLDGVGCAIVCRSFFGVDNVNVDYCDYNEINTKVTNFLNEGTDEYDAIFITDISVAEEVAEKINDTAADKIMLIDHHATALWLNKYDWATVIVKGIKGKESGTSLFNEWLQVHMSNIRTNPMLSEFAELVRRYDTWEWKTRYGVLKPKKMNDLLYIIGRERFVARPHEFEYFTTNFSANEELLLELEAEKESAYIEKKKSEVRRLVVEGFTVGIVFADRYLSSLGEEIAKVNEDIDIVAMVNPPKAVSFRTVKSDIHLGEFAQKFGGGGHAKAAGCSLNVNSVNSLGLAAYLW